MTCQCGHTFTTSWLKVANWLKLKVVWGSKTLSCRVLPNSFRVALASGRLWWPKVCISIRMTRRARPDRKTHLEMTWLALSPSFRFPMTCDSLHSVVYLLILLFSARMQPQWRPQTIFKTFIKSFEWTFHLPCMTCRCSGLPNHSSLHAYGTIASWLGIQCRSGTKVRNLKVAPPSCWYPKTLRRTSHNERERYGRPQAHSSGLWTPSSLKRRIIVIQTRLARRLKRTPSCWRQCTSSCQAGLCRLLESKAVRT